MPRLCLAACVALLLTPACERQTAETVDPQSVASAIAAAPLQRLPTPFDLPAAPGAQAQPPEAAPSQALPPLQLTSADGAGLQLRRLDVRTVIDGPLVVTELHATFHNPEDRVREGRFQLVLPDGAALSRFAMLQQGGWMEGEVVELAKAQRVYEDFLHRRQDPALLQQDAGNTFSARVFPIPARGDKSFILTWSEELADPRTPWRLPLRGLPKLAEFKARVFLHTAQKAAAAGGSLGATLGQVQVLQVDKRDWQPDDDLRVDPQVAGPQPAAVRAGSMVAARVQVPGNGAKGLQQLDKVVLLVDTSASMALAWQPLQAALDRTLAHLAQRGASEVAVLAFDQQVAEICRGKPSDCQRVAPALLQARGPLGASDLGQALQAAGQWAPRLGGAVRVLLLSDGMASAGEVEAPRLAARAKRLAAHGVTRLDTLTVTVARDRELLKALTQAGLSQDGQVVEAASPAALAQLDAATLGAVAVQVPGASWSWPKELRGMQPGQPALIFAELPEGASLTVQLSGAAHAAVALEPKEAAAALLERAWVGARIRMLLHRATDGDPDLAGAFRAQATGLSVKHRVLCPTTALLVLETEADYQRYAIDRQALADILTVSAEGAAVLQRRQSVIAAEAPADALGTWPAQAQLRRAVGDPAPAEEARREDGRPDAAKLFAERDEHASPPPPAAAPHPPAAARTAAAGRALGDSADWAGGGRAGLGFAGTGSGGGGQGYGRLNGLGAIDTGGGTGRNAQPDAVRRTQRQRIAALAEGAADLGDASPRELLDHLRQHPAITGEFAAIRARLARKDAKGALQAALQWRAAAPTEVLPLVALGEALLANQDPVGAARAYGSIVDLHPQRADLRRFAGNLLDTLGAAGAPLAIDTYAKAVAQRPDHPSGAVMLALAQARAGQWAAAEASLAAADPRRWRSGNFPGVERGIASLQAMIAAAKARASGAPPAEAPVPRVLALVTWETDANDVDSHFFDRHGRHGFYRNLALPGAELYADITTGYGPEFVALGKDAAGPLHFFAHYYRKGPMGWGMGRLAVLQWDGKALRLDSRPFVLMVDDAHVDLGVVNP